MEIRESRDEKIVILAPRGEWDAEQSPAFREKAFALADAGDLYFAVDFRGVTFIDSSALSCLVSLFKKVNPTMNGDVKLFGMNPDVREIFRQTRLDRVFEIGDTYEGLRDGFLKRLEQ